MSNQHSQTYHGFSSSSTGSFSSSSYSFSSSSHSSRTDSSGQTRTVSTASNPSGTTIHETFQVAGQPAQSKTTRLPAGGTRHLEGQNDTSRRIEEVSDADKEYEERIEDEYAKREGGAWVAESGDDLQRHILFFTWQGTCLHYIMIRSDNIWGEVHVNSGKPLRLCWLPSRTADLSASTLVLRSLGYTWFGLNSLGSIHSSLEWSSLLYNLFKLLDALLRI